MPNTVIINFICIAPFIENNDAQSAEQQINDVERNDMHSDPLKNRHRINIKHATST